MKSRLSVAANVSSFQLFAAALVSRLGFWADRGGPRSDLYEHALNSRFIGASKALTLLYPPSPPPPPVKETLIGPLVQFEQRDLDLEFFKMDPIKGHQLIVYRVFG